MGHEFMAGIPQTLDGCEILARFWPSRKSHVWMATDTSGSPNGGGAQKAIFTAEGQPFHLIAGGVPAFDGLPRADNSNQAG